MVANPPALFHSHADHTNNTDIINEDEDDFGDFMFSSPFSSQTPSLFPYPAPTLLFATNSTDDEDWGDFVASQLGSYSMQPQSSLPLSRPLDTLRPSSKAWVKPRGAIPLSIFGEEETEEAVPATIDSGGMFENGFGSYSLPNYSSPRPTARKLNDLIDKLYEQVSVSGKEEADFEEKTWEFKDALSPDVRPKVVVNRLENGWKSMDNQETGRVDVFVANGELTNESIGHNHSRTDNTLQVILPSFENGTLGSGTNGYKVEFPENATRNGSTEKILDDQGELLHDPEKHEDIKEVKWTMLDIDDLNFSAYANGTKSSNGNSGDHYEHYAGAININNSPATLTSIVQNLYEKDDMPHATLPPQRPINIEQEINQHGKSSAYVNGVVDFDHFDWEFQRAVEITEAGKIASYESDQILTNEPSSYNLVDLYCRLKEESLSLIVHHLAVLKVPDFSGVTPEVKKINDEIKEAYGNLQEMADSENSCTGKKSARQINELLLLTKASNFILVEQEFHLYERLLAAEKHLNAAVNLFEHSSSVLQTLRLMSREQQLFYINAWSKLASACVEELQLGAKIWTESVNGNISKQILAKANNYFIALGEVYRVLKILKATVRVYMPWLLSNMEDSSRIVTCLEKGNEAWINSGLEEALQIISCNMELDYKGLVKALLQSIKLIDKINEPIFLDPALHSKNAFCRFSLLPFDKLPGIKTVVWNGDWYISKIANFWANRISPDPPELPSIMPS